MAPPRFKRKKLVVQGIFAKAKQEATVAQLEPEVVNAIQPHKRPRSMLGRSQVSSATATPNSNWPNYGTQSSTNATTERNAAPADLAIATTSTPKLDIFTKSKQKKSKFQLQKEIRDAKEKQAAAEAAAMYESFAVSLDAPTDPQVTLPLNSRSFMRNSPHRPQAESLVTTNIHISNLPRDTTESDLRQLFGRFGPLHSVKVIWPGVGVPFSKGSTLTGFVAFVQRRDADEVFDSAGALQIGRNRLSLSWGKPVLLARLAPGSLSRWTSRGVWKHPVPAREIQSIQFPSEGPLVERINRLAKFVSLYGAIFEAQIASDQRNNPAYAFLWNHSSPHFLFYRWRVHAYVMGEGTAVWRMTPFQFVVDGPWFLPPPPPSQSDLDVAMATGAAQERRLEQERNVVYSTLQEPEKIQLLELLSNLSRSHAAIGRVMAFCYDRAEAARDCSRVLVDSLLGRSSRWFPRVSPPSVLVARLFVISDVLHNSSSLVRNASAFRDAIAPRLPDVVLALREAEQEVTGRMTANAMRERVLHVLGVWDRWMLFPNAFLDGLEAVYCASKEQVEAVLGGRGRGVAAPEDNVEELRSACRLQGVPAESADPEVLRGWLAIAKEYSNSKRAIEDESRTKEYSIPIETTEDESRTNEYSSSKQAMENESRTNEYSNSKQAMEDEPSIDPSRQHKSNTTNDAEAQGLHVSKEMTKIRDQLGVGHKGSVEVDHQVTEVDEQVTLENLDKVVTLQGDGSRSVESGPSKMNEESEEEDIDGEPWTDEEDIDGQSLSD